MIFPKFFDKLLFHEKVTYRTIFFPPALFFLLVIKALLLIAIIVYANIGLGPDEAQYWTWSRELDWGYYSKPPGVAWQIAIGTTLFGQTEWGVRFVSVIIAFFQALVVYKLALSSALSSRASIWCSLIMAVCPLGILGSFFAITDGGLLLSWSCAVLAVTTALQRQQTPSPVMVGLCIMVGALFKWPIYIFWFFFLLARYWYFQNLSFSSIMLGMLISLIGLFPSLWWNMQHNWATFRHVAATIAGGNSSGQNFLAPFIGAQMALVSPIIFILLILAFYQFINHRYKLNPALYFQGFVSLTILAIAITMSNFQKIQGNWAIFAYPTSFVILTWDIFVHHAKRIVWLKLGLLFSMIAIGIMFVIPYAYNSHIFSPYIPSWKLNPLKHNFGWPELSLALEDYGYHADQDFLFSDKYQTSSLLSFYSPQQKRAYFLNLQGIRNNQFCYWPSMVDQQLGKNGYFIWVENAPHLAKNWQEQRAFYLQALQPYFKNVIASELIPLRTHGTEIVKGVLIFRCENLNATEVISQSNSY